MNTNESKVSLEKFGNVVDLGGKVSESGGMSEPTFSDLPKRHPERILSDGLAMALKMGAPAEMVANLAEELGRQRAAGAKCPSPNTQAPSDFY